MKRNLIYVLSLLLLFLIIGCSNRSSEKERETLDATITDIRHGEVYKNRKIDDVLLVSTNAYYRAKEIGYDRGMLGALGLIADNELMKGDTKRALKSATEGISLAEKMGESDLHTQLLCVKGLALLDQSYMEDGKQLLLQALAKSATIKDPDAQHWRKQNIYISMVNLFDGRYSEFPADLDSVATYHQLAYNETQKVSPKSPMYHRSRIQGQYLLALKILDSSSKPIDGKLLNQAYRYIEQGESLAREQNYKDWIAFGLLFKGIILSEKGLHKEALNFYLQAEPTLRYLGVYYELNTALKLISDSYGALNDHKNQSTYLKLAASISDSLHTKEKDAVRENNLISKGNSTSSLSYMQLILVFLFVLFISLAIFIIKKRKQAINDLTEEISNEFVNHVDSSEGNKIDMEKLKDVIALAKSSNELFYFSFLELYPDFNKKLLEKNPLLTTSDTEFCAFLKLNFDTKEIARYRNMSVRSVESKKYRIRKKIGLTKDDDIYAYFMNF